MAQIEFNYNNQQYRAEIEEQFDENGELLPIDYASYAIQANEIDTPVPVNLYKYKIYSFMDRKVAYQYKPPYDFDYTNLGLHKKRTIVKGEVTKVEYYAEYDGTTYNNLVVEEHNTYNRDDAGYVKSRDKVIYWIDENNGQSESKDTRKYYNVLESLDEGYTRRSNIINDAKVKTIGLILMTEYGGDYGVNMVNFIASEALGRVFLSENTNTIQQYKDGIRQPLLDAVANSTLDRMDNPLGGGVTVRSFITAELTY